MVGEESVLETPLWAFSLSVYGAEGVEAECLDLQERLQLDVNVLLFAAYMGAFEGVVLAPQDVAAAVAAVAPWHGEIVRALRGARRALKPASLDESNPLRAPAAGLRAKVKAAELDSEQIEQAMLWQWSRRQLTERTRSEAGAALATNLQSVLAHYGAPAGTSVPAGLLAAALNFAASKS